MNRVPPSGQQLGLLAPMRGWAGARRLQLIAEESTYRRVLPPGVLDQILLAPDLGKELRALLARAEEHDSGVRHLAFLGAMLNEIEKGVRLEFGRNVHSPVDHHEIHVEPQQEVVTALQLPQRHNFRPRRRATLVERVRVQVQPVAVPAGIWLDCRRGASRSRCAWRPAPSDTIAFLMGRRGMRSPTYARTAGDCGGGSSHMLCERPSHLIRRHGGCFCETPHSCSCSTPATGVAAESVRADSRAEVDLLPRKGRVDSVEASDRLPRFPATSEQEAGNDLTRDSTAPNGWRDEIEPLKVSRVGDVPARSDGTNDARVTVAAQGTRPSPASASGPRTTSSLAKQSKSALATPTAAFHPGDTPWLTLRSTVDRSLRDTRFCLGYSVERDHQLPGKASERRRQARA